MNTRVPLDQMKRGLQWMDRMGWPTTGMIEGVKREYSVKTILERWTDGTGKFWSKYTTRSCLLDGSWNYNRYWDIMDSYLLLFAYHNHEISSKSFAFMKDRATAHTSNFTHNCLEQNQIFIIFWPSCSPDLNPIENAWGYLTQQVCVKSIQFNSVPTLHNHIISAWNNVLANIIELLNKWMRGHCVHVLIQQGKLMKC